ncbi:lipoprotein [Streptomyces naganishii JCM 4654]|uniref:Lipoprotein n=2 Tax=Streptomyces naganishii TaxID=285447 RepID=A0A919CT11_9ACTN|nr:lipoprotein [Streptomyces naganishii JCM 4654]
MLAVAGAAVATAVLAGCGSGGDAAAKAPPTATGSLESLAAQVKCKPDIQTDADTIRQAICTNPAGKFVLATFSTDRGQREWINEAKDYGGFYLVGRKWVAVGDDGVVTALRGTLGGDVEIGADHHAHTG